jgi:hypothetical protein
MEVDGHAILRVNNYSLEDGGPSVMDREYGDGLGGEYIEDSPMPPKPKPKARPKAKAKPKTKKVPKKASPAELAAQYRRNLFIRTHWDLFDGFSSMKSPPAALPNPNAKSGSRSKGQKKEKPPKLRSGKPKFLRAPLRDYQEAGVNWLLQAYHNGIGAILVRLFAHLLFDATNMWLSNYGLN